MYSDNSTFDLDCTNTTSLNCTKTSHHIQDPNFVFVSHLIGIILGWISITTSCLVIRFWLHSKKTRSKHAIKLIGLLSLWDLIMELSLAQDHLVSLTWAEITEGPLCTFFGIFFYFGYVCVWLWTAGIALNLAYVITQKPKKKQTQIPIKYLLLVTLGGASSTTILLAAIGGIGRTITNESGWCLIRNGQPVVYILFAALPCCLIFLSISLLYGFSCIKLYRKMGGFNSEGSKIPEASRVAYIRAIKKSIIFPVAFLFSWFFPAMWTIWFVFGGESKWLTTLCIIGVNISGTVNGICYLLVHEVMTRIDPSRVVTSVAMSSRTDRSSRNSVVIEQEHQPPAEA